MRLINERDSYLVRRQAEIDEGQLKVVFLLGETGTGKSSVANSLLGKILFKTSCDIKSETSHMQGVFLNFPIDNHKHKILLFDTPGFGDSEGRD